MPSIMCTVGSRVEGRDIILYGLDVSDRRVNEVAQDAYFNAEKKCFSNNVFDDAQTYFRRMPVRPKETEIYSTLLDIESLIAKTKCPTFIVVTLSELQQLSKALGADLHVKLRGFEFIRAFNEKEYRFFPVNLQATEPAVSPRSIAELDDADQAALAFDLEPELETKAELDATPDDCNVSCSMS
jgi:hypothetical protein